MIQIYDPFSLEQRTYVSPFPGNIIPQNRFDPQAVKALAPTRPGRAADSFRT